MGSKIGLWVNKGGRGLCKSLGIGLFDDNTSSRIFYSHGTFYFGNFNERLLLHYAFLEGVDGVISILVE